MGSPGSLTVERKWCRKFKKRRGALEEVKKGDSGHMLAEIREMQKSAESGRRSNVSPALPTPRTQTEWEVCLVIVAMGWWDGVGSDLI